MEEIDLNKYENDLELEARMKAKNYADKYVLSIDEFKDEDSYLKAFDDYADGHWEEFVVDWVTNCISQ